jgi:monoterpene epsilon-lactone hydrolase
LANPEITAVRGMLAQGALGETWEEMRTGYDALGGVLPTAPDVTLSAVNAGGVPAEWSTTPGADQSRAILYLHGGGYVIGSIKSHRHLATELGRAAGTRVLALDYRLAPEAPFPAAVDDGLAGYRFLLKSGLSASSIAIAGDSAGGGLTVATLLAIRDAGLPQPACGFCISPWIDLEATGGSMTSKAAEDPMVQKEPLSLMTAAYLGGSDPHHPLAAPLHANFKGIAPLLIHVGSAETLLDDSIRLAALAGASEVPVRLEIWPQMIHVWHFFHPMVADARRALTEAGAFIKGQMLAG